MSLVGKNAKRPALTALKKLKKKKGCKAWNRYEGDEGCG